MLTCEKRIAMLCIAALMIACNGNDSDGGDSDTQTDTTPDDPVGISMVYGTYALTEDAEAAIAIAPTWLQSEMAVNLVGVESERQDELAALMLNINDPRGLDEVAFCLAHISPSHLNRTDFYPELIIDNVTYIYDVDGDLQFSDIIEYGSAYEGGDYYSTISYFIEIDGVVQEEEMEREYYYWYVMFPVIEDDKPTYINPDTGASADSPTGRFWRDYLYYEADEGYTPLRDYLLEKTVVWKGKTAWHADKFDDNGAIGAISQWVSDSMSWGSEVERPVQPVRIYAIHLGRCGEHQDLGTAAARSALIPATNASNWGNDHVWNEFWINRWMQWQSNNAATDKWGEYYHYGIGDDSNCDLVVDDETSYYDPTADDDGDGFTTVDGDCNDHSNSIYPGATELADGKDNDCNGVVDDGAEAADKDEDGQTIADGDCNDNVATIYTGATEIADDLMDNDCDSVADDGTDTADADEDGVSIADGDCNDTDKWIYPGALEKADGKDNDCNGLVDDGADVADGDEDGVTIADGDCNDSSARTYPGAVEVEEFRALSISACRGDGKVWTVTERYGEVFTLEVNVTDAAGLPVDGATVMIAGSRLEGDDLYFATCSTTDVDGFTSIQPGANFLGGDKAYYGRVDSDVGSYPASAGTVYPIVDSPVDGSTHEWNVQLTGNVPENDVNVVSADAASGWMFEMTWAFAGYVGGANYMTNVEMRDPADPFADVYLVNDENLLLFQEGAPFEAIFTWHEEGAEGDLQVEIPSDQGRWYAIFSPNTVSGGVVAELSATLTGDGEEGYTLANDTPVLAGDWAAVKIVID